MGRELFCQDKDWREIEGLARGIGAWKGYKQAHQTFSATPKGTSDSPSPSEV